MCDCYTAKCEFCRNQIEVHIGDFSADRDDVNVVCHECVEAGKAINQGYEAKLWSSEPCTIEREDQVWEEYGGETIDIGVIGAIVMFYIAKDSGGYGIHLN